MAGSGSQQVSNRNGSVQAVARNNNDNLTDRSGLIPFNPAHNQSHHAAQASGANNGFSNGNQPAQNNNYRNENILCAVLALLKELDESGLELVKRDIDRKLQNKKQSK